MALVGSSTSKGALNVYQHNSIEKGRYYVTNNNIEKGRYYVKSINEHNISTRGDIMYIHDIDGVDQAPVAQEGGRGDDLIDGAALLEVGGQGHGDLTAQPVGGNHNIT